MTDYIFNGDFTRVTSGTTTPAGWTYNDAGFGGRSFYTCGSNTSTPVILCGAKVAPSVNATNADIYTQNVTGLTIGNSYKLNFKVAGGGSPSQLLVLFPAAPEGITATVSPAGQPSVVLNDPARLGTVNATWDCINGEFTTMQYTFQAVSSYGLLEFRVSDLTTSTFWIFIAAVSLVDASSAPPA